MNYLGYLESQQEIMVNALQILVSFESPSGEKALLDQLSGYLAKQFSDLGAAVEMLEQAEAGNHLRASWGNGPEQVLVLGHIDTVWPRGEIGRRPFRIEGGKAFGPGIYDMKGGIVQSLFALKAIASGAKKPPRKIVFLFTSDEETGSSTSRCVIEAEARKSAFVLVPEPAAGAHGAVKVSRSGWGMYDVKVTGRMAHAGNDHMNGINAIEEMAHQILKLQAMTDYSTGTTVSVGQVQGGTCSNVVPDLAIAKVDLRARTEKELAAANARILALTPFLKSAEVTVSGGINRQPMLATPANTILYQKARAFARELGFELAGTHAGGISDGNLTSALGIPTLDGLGSVGDGAHAVHEHIFLESLVPRTALIAKLIAE